MEPWSDPNNPSMKNLPRFRPIPLLATCALLLFAGAPAFAGEPIPGVDVKLGKNPGGSIVARTTSDKAGRFVFENLTAGQYELIVTPSQTKASINTTRSNIKRPNIAMNRGVQVAEVAAEIGSGPASAEITITAPKGTITGIVTRAEASGSSESADRSPAPPKGK